MPCAVCSCQEGRTWETSLLFRRVTGWFAGSDATRAPSRPGSRDLGRHRLARLRAAGGTAAGQSKDAWTLANGVKWVSIRSPREIGYCFVNEPDMIRCPGSIRRPNSESFLASQATAPRG